ncbi:MAG: PilZ domain-containing protein [Bryobacterales bacterium]|nr:PilZ domain-containing protein [Bryobacterales bacterium]
MERRREPRFDCRKPAIVTLLSSNAPPIPATLQNISGRGARITAECAVPLSAPVRIDAGDLLLLGDVCYCHQEANGFALGIALAHSVSDVAALTALMGSLAEEGAGASPSEAPWVSPIARP